MTKPLHIPQTKKLKGLKVHCYKCGTTVDAVCKKSGTAIDSCKYGQDHVFKVYAHVPGTENARKTKTLSTRNLEEARRLTLEFQKEIKHGVSGSVSLSSLPATLPLINLPSQKHTSKNLIDLMTHYVGFLNNDPEIVEEFKRVSRSSLHVTDIERTLKYFVVALHEAGIPVEIIRADELTDKIIGKFHSYLTQTRKFSAPSYNRAMGHMTTFFNYLMQEKFVDRNPFITVPRAASVPNKKVIKQTIYEELLEIIQKPELGMQVLSTGERKNNYKIWMKSAVMLGLTTGSRNEEIVKIKWTDILEESDVPICLRVVDYKVSRQKKLTAENLKYKYLPLTKDLWKVLLELGYEQYKNTDTYILAPEEKMQRITMCKFLSRSFTHYFSLLNKGKLTFKNLRKTYLSALTAEKGIEDAQMISGHGGKQVMRDHYINYEVIAEAAKDFTVFPTEENGAKELEENRKKSKGFSLDR